MQELARWLERAAKGEEAAYRELFRHYRPLVARLAGGFASLDRDEVEDVVQETFTRAFKSLGALREPAAFDGWLFSIARNRARSLVQGKQSAARNRDALAHETDETSPAIPLGLQVEREAAMVRELIAQLPEGAEKRTVQLFYVEGALTTREIAEQLGVGKSAVTMRLERFRAKVKVELLRRVAAARWE
jgi:RNA polymerase sigma-70 factor (ECF subfamily)